MIASTIEERIENRVILLFQSADLVNINLEGNLCWAVDEKESQKWEILPESDWGRERHCGVIWEQRKPESCFICKQWYHRAASQPSYKNVAAGWTPSPGLWMQKQNRRRAWVVLQYSRCSESADPKSNSASGWLLRVYPSLEAGEEVGRLWGVESTLGP